ncbi:MAG: hypothetical protein LBH41_02030 [Rickettsiales bacterium]|jgi:deoxyribose-phosphate aldolase|nr:hypothetical protein [Rickettsiales bacterium]
MFRMEDEYFGRCVLYARGESDLVFACREAVSRHYAELSAPKSCIGDAWKWTQRSGVKLFARLDFLSSLALPEVVFREIKSALTEGAGGVELCLAPSFFAAPAGGMPKNADEVLRAALEAAGGRALKISAETAFLSTVGAIRGAVAAAARYGVGTLKTASGLYAGASSLEHLNAALEESRDSGPDIDFLFDPSIGALAVESAFRIAGKILANDSAFRVSVPFRPK